ncbi:MAG: glycerophosphodiester phosphodiesterase [Methylomonas sp.]
MRIYLILAILQVLISGCAPMNYGNVITIAHRGASGYLPEHTLAGKVLAYGMGADFIEQDVLITKDNQAVVLHDLYLEAVTDVADIFPGRSRTDGHFYVIDFSLSELRALNIHERVDPKSGVLAFPGRFPLNGARFQIATLEEEIALIQGLNKSSGKNIGIYTEIKSPAWHRMQGKDIGKIVLTILNEKGYTESSDNIYVQCFDPDELKRLRFELHSRLKLIQLIGDNLDHESGADYEYLQMPAGLNEISQYADGIGPGLTRVVTGRDGSGRLVFSKLVENAHKNGLQVHVYTLRKDRLPPFTHDFNELLTALFEQSVDGVFTDFPDVVAAAKVKFMEAKP